MRIKCSRTVGYSLMGLMILVGVAAAQSGEENLVLGFTNLAALDETVEGHYEGWAVVDGSPVSTGKFNVNNDGMPVELGGGGVIDEFDASQDISGATAIKISIEPAGDVDMNPSGLIILSGDVAGGETELRTDVPDLAILETMTTGAYILATPSDNHEDDTNDEMGVWFLTTPGPDPGFMNLPDIGPGWAYEGWVVDLSDPMNPMPYSTGRFSMAEGVDSDEAGCNGGGPPFPGQDFVPFQCPPVLDLDTGDFAAVVSIEPEPDNQAGPFQLKPLADAISTDAVGMNNEMTNQTAATFPTGTAVLWSATPTVDVSWGSIKAAF